MAKDELTYWRNRPPVIDAWDDLRPGRELSAKLDSYYAVSSLPTLRFVMFCTISKSPFLVVCGLDGNVLYLLDSEAEVPRELAGDNSSLEELTGFSYNASRWTGCARCGAGPHDERAFWWSLSCRSCKNKPLCYGSMMRGINTCLCGTIHGKKIIADPKTPPIIGLLPRGSSY